MHICISNLTIIGSYNGLAPGRCQTIIWTNAGILLSGPLGRNFSEILIKTHIFSFRKMRLKMLSGKWQLCCLGHSVLTHWGRVMHICASKLTINGSDNGLSPSRRQAIIWTNAIILLIGSLGTNFSKILIVMYTFSLKKCMWKCRLKNGSHLVSASMCYHRFWLLKIFLRLVVCMGQIPFTSWGVIAGLDMKCAKCSCYAHTGPHFNTKTIFPGIGIPIIKIKTCGRLNIKMSSYQYRDPHVKDKTVLRPSYL